MLIIHCITHYLQDMQLNGHFDGTVKHNMWVYIAMSSLNGALYLVFVALVTEMQ